MAKNVDVRHVRIEIAPEEHRTIRLASAVQDKTMTRFVRDSALAAATEQVAKLGSGGLHGAESLAEVR